MHIFGKLSAIYGKGGNFCDFQFFALLITKTCLYNFDPRKPHFYIVKLEFIGVDTHNLCFEQKYEN